MGFVRTVLARSAPRRPSAFSWTYTNLCKKKKINLAANEIEPRSAGETRVRLGQPRDQQEERTVGVRPV